MVLDRRIVERRLAELDRVLAELGAMGPASGDGLDASELEEELAARWSLERGLLAAANLVIDVANHIAAGHFATHPATYEDGLRLLATRNVVDENTYGSLRGLGGFRNVLAHEYLDIDVEEVIRWRVRILDVLPRWIGEVAAWMDGLESAAEDDR